MHDSLLVGANESARPDTLCVCVGVLIHLADLFPTVTIMLGVTFDTFLCAAPVVWAS